MNSAMIPRWVGAAVLASLAWAHGVAVAQAGAAAAPAQSLARGAYLARIGGCVSCHTEPRNGAPLAGGRAVPMPFGVLHSTNITPDRVHGIGGYSFEDFDRVMRAGTAPGGRHLYPAMPYTAYAKASEADLRDLYDYLLHGVAPVAAPTPPNQIDFPFNQRWGLVVWKALFVPGPGYRARENQTAEWNRGAYLVQSFGHCGACHTPRGLAFQERAYDERSGLFLTGQVNDSWYAANLTGDPGSGLGRVPAEAVASMLATGHGDGLVTSGTMAQEVEESMQYLSDADLRAVAGYLKSLPPQQAAGAFEARGQIQAPPSKGNYMGDVESVGAAVYRGFCARCHQPDGRGVPSVFPRLAGNPSVLAREPSTLIRLVVEGGRSPATAKGPASQAMPAFAGTLTDVQMAQVLTFARESWGNDAPPVSTDAVSKLRQAMHH